MSTNNEVAIPNTFQQPNVLEGTKSKNLFYEEDKTRNLYKIDKPLYPIPALVNYYKHYGFDYDKIKDKYPEVFPYDNSWSQWYRDIVQVAKSRKMAIQPIKREVPVIYRYKFGDQEKIVWSERFTGTSTKTGANLTFKHINGMYFRHLVETRYEEDKDMDINVLKGSQKIYWIDYDPKIIDELYSFAPLTKQQKLQIMIMNRPYGNLGFFKNEEFKHNTIEDLTRSALNAKGLAPSAQELKQFSKSDVSVDKDDFEDAIRIISNNPKGLDRLAELLDNRKKENNNREKQNK